MAPEGDFSLGGVGGSQNPGLSGCGEGFVLLIIHSRSLADHEEDQWKVASFRKVRKKCDFKRAGFPPGELKSTHVDVHSHSRHSMAQARNATWTLLERSQAHSLVPLTAAEARYGSTHGPGWPWGRLIGRSGMKNENLIQQWIDHCTPRQRVRLAHRIQEQLEVARQRRLEHEGGASPTQIMSTVLFVECATDLDLRPLELHGLMSDPREQSLEAVVNLAIMQLTAGHESRGRCIDSSKTARST